MASAVAEPADSGTEPMEFAAGKTWSYYGGREFPGAKGSVKWGSVDDLDVLAIQYDFSGGGAYVAARSPVDFAGEVSEFSFDVKASCKQKLVVRLVDSTKQTHQWPILYDRPDRWVSIKTSTKEPAPKHYAGADDGIVHYPIIEVMLCVAKSELGSALEPGEVAFSKLRFMKKQ